MSKLSNEGTEMKNKKRNLVSDKGEWSHNGVKSSRDTKEEAGCRLISGLSFHESRAATVPTLGVLLNNGSL